MKLRVLVVSDHESEYIWDYFDKSVFAGVDVTVSCGDLAPSYLTFLATMIPVPLLYVRGNHDGRYEETPPEGCIDLEENLLVVKGVRFFGLGGCKSGSKAANSYTERDMERRILRRRLELHRRGVDVFVGHAPASGLGDEPGGYHEGFACFRALIERYRPAYFLHGHRHLNYGRGAQRILHHGDTTIVNGYNYCIVDMDFPDRSEGKR